MKVDIVDTIPRNTLVQDTTTKAVLGVRNANDAGYIRGVTPHLEAKNRCVLSSNVTGLRAPHEQGT